MPKIRLLSVIVPTCGRSRKLSNLLEALDKQAQSTKAEFEVLLVVDGQGEEPKGEYAFPFQIIHTPFVGAGRARNLGIEHARGDAILFLNDDVVPEPGFIDAHVAALNSGDQAVLGDSPWLTPHEPTAFDGFIAHTPTIFNRGSLIDQGRYGFRYGWTLNLSMRREIINQLDHPFHPDLSPIYFEDIEFVYRCFGDKDELRYCSSARAVHDHRVSPMEYFTREALLGIMSVVFHQTNPVCHDTIFPYPPAQHAPIAAKMLAYDTRDHRRAMDRFITLASRPLESGNASDQAMMLYDLHLPLKRRAFRLGLCAMCEQPIQWDRRVEQAQSLIGSDPVFTRLQTHPAQGSSSRSKD